MEAPELLKCPISMELMEDPVTISTGVTYERKNIEKWLFKYKKTTCPATMQHLQSFDLTPNHTLKSLISSLLQSNPSTSSSNRSSSTTETRLSDLENLSTLLASVETSPFKISSLRKVKSTLQTSNDLKRIFVESGGIETVSRIMNQSISDATDFGAFQACEEAVAVLDALQLADTETVRTVTGFGCIRTMLQTLLHRGSAEARINAMSILLKVSKIDPEWADKVMVESDTAIVKSLLELLSDDFATKLSSTALDLLLQFSATSAKNRIGLIESGAVSILVELLPDSNRHVCEKTLLLLKRLCEFSQGRVALSEHRLGIASVSKKILRVSELATKLGVKVLWLMCSYHCSQRVLDDMIAFGVVRKLLALIHLSELGSTKDRAVKIIKLHGNFWRQYPCFPSELQEFLRLSRHSRH